MREANAVPQPKVPKPAVALLLTQEQAEVLLDVAHRVGGHPCETPRGRVDEIRQALESAGFQRRELRVEPHSQNSIYYAEQVSINEF